MLENFHLIRQKFDCAFSQARHYHLDLTLLWPGIFEKSESEGICYLGVKSYLGIERVALQLILALELPGVSLVHGQSVLSSFKDFGLVHLLNS